MSVRQSLLAILAEGDCYGYQLRVEFERRTSRSLNVGQVYATLDRLERDGLVARGDTDAAGHIYYGATDDGRAEAARWLIEPTTEGIAEKIALALTLPGADAAALLTAQRAVTMATLDRCRAEPRDTLSRDLIVEHRARAAGAELAWLDHCETLLPSARPYGVLGDAPRRGRPARSTSV